MTIFRGLGIDDYHRHKAVTNTKLKTFRASPLLYHKVYNLHTVALPDKECFKLGRAADCLIFDGREAYQEQYIVPPSTYLNEKGEQRPWRFGANYTDAWRNAQVMQGLTVLTTEQAIQAEKMLQAITHDPLAAALLSQGEPQVTFRRDSVRFGMEIQVRPDWLSEKPIDVPQLELTSGGLPYLCDLKSIRNFDDIFKPLDPENPWMGKTIWSLGYHRQSGMQQWVAEKDIGRTAHFLIFVETVEPMRVAVVQLDPDYIDAGWSDVEADLFRLKNCITANKWPGSPERVLTLRAPLRVLETSAREAIASSSAGIPVGQEVV